MEYFVFRISPFHLQQCFFFRVKGLFSGSQMQFHGHICLARKQLDHHVALHNLISGSQMAISSQRKSTDLQQQA